MGIYLDDEFESVVNIKVAGIGGGGCNAVDRMISSGMRSVEFLSINTDMQAMMRSKSPNKLVIGDKLTKGRGAGGVPERGQRAAEESRDEIAAALKGTQMLFVTAGMGGGTGTGAAPIVAEVARELGILTIGIVTKPFAFEGKHRADQAELGITAMREHVDSLVVIPNERLKMVSESNVTFLNAFGIADDILRQAVQSISDLINLPGVINLDFEDLQSIMKGAGASHMGVGRATGKDKAEQAAAQAIASPLLETSINGAKGVILNITASQDIALSDVDFAANMIQQAAHPDVNLIFGFAYDENMEDEMSITLIATGFDEDNAFNKSKDINLSLDVLNDDENDILAGIDKIFGNI